jgi:hypothetical protein
MKKWNVGLTEKVVNSGDFVLAVTSRIGVQGSYFDVSRWSYRYRAIFGPLEMYGFRIVNVEKSSIMTQKYRIFFSYN